MDGDRGREDLSQKGDGTQVALREDQLTARARAALRLREFPDAEIEQVLMDSAVNEADAFVGVQALWSLEEFGTDRAVPVVERPMNDRDPEVARKAREVAAAIRARSAAPRKWRKPTSQRARRAGHIRRDVDTHVDQCHSTHSVKSDSE